MPFARKRFGQHFLEAAWADKVVRAIEPKADDIFIEIGPGRGALTGRLAARARSVIAFEIDRSLAAQLEATAPPNVRIVPGDFLDFSPTKDLTTAEVGPGGDDSLRVAGNLPYNVASPILFKLSQSYACGFLIADATVMLQREVADRLLASPGTRDYGVLTILMSYRSTVERLMSLPPGAFRPPPKVHSTLVRLRFRPPMTPARDELVFAAMVKAIFSRRRKTLANALLAFDRSARVPPSDAIERAGLDGRLRPEMLTPRELIRLADVFSST